MKVYTIYKATNIINNRVYIGFASCWPNRIQQHKYNSQKRTQKLYCAIRKYGWDNFVWEPIYQSIDKDHTLNCMENHFIEQYNSYCEGYNSSLGGEAPMLGLSPTKETINKMSISIKNYWSTPEGKNKKSIIQKENWNRPEYRSRYEKNYTLVDPDGVMFNITNLKKFCEENQLPHNNMYKVANGKRKTCCGWKVFKN